MSFMQKHFEVCFSNRENNRKQHEKLLSRPPNMDRWQNPMEAHSYQDHSKTGNLHGDKTSGKSVLSRPSTKCVKSEPKSSTTKAIESQKVHKKGSFKTIHDGSKKDTSFKTIVNRVNNLNPRYMVPADEVTLVISDPKSRKKTQKVTEQPSSGPPPPGS